MNTTSLKCFDCETECDGSHVVNSHLDTPLYACHQCWEKWTLKHGVDFFRDYCRVLEYITKEVKI